MQIQPPAPDVVGTQQLRRRMGAMGMLFIGIIVLLLVTLAAWLMLWGGGIKQAARTEALPPAAGQQP